MPETASDELPATIPVYEHDDLHMKSWKLGWNAFHNAMTARIPLEPVAWRFRLYPTETGWTMTKRKLSPKEIGPRGVQEPLYAQTRTALQQRVEDLEAAYNREVSLRDSEQRQAEEQSADNPYDHGRALYERGWFDATKQAEARERVLREALEHIADGTYAPLKVRDIARAALGGKS